MYVELTLCYLFYVIRKITNRMNMFILYINYFKHNEILISFF